MKTYILKPTMTFKTLADASDSLKPRDQESSSITDLIAPVAKAKSRFAAALPPVQSLPRAVIDPAKPMVKLGLDVHLLFIMASIQRGHTTPQSPRKFSAGELAAQIKEKPGGNITRLDNPHRRCSALVRHHVPSTNSTLTCGKCAVT
ncbi:MAG TPA: hypothetical protein VFW05_09935 [Verrucomicrobiae bacterium]|nr:hypothetical protein [Verrucomicrobiae bacterium]